LNGYQLTPEQIRQAQMMAAMTNQQMSPQAPQQAPQMPQQAPQQAPPQQQAPPSQGYDTGYGGEDIDSIPFSHGAHHSA